MADYAAASGLIYRAMGKMAIQGLVRQSVRTNRGF